VHPHRAFRAEIERMLSVVQRELGLSAPLSLEVPPEASLGDLAVPCFPLAKQLRKAPAAIASELADKLWQLRQGGWVERIAAAGPYVNFTLDRMRLAAAVLADPEAALAATRKEGKVLLEHTSANPNGPLHIGRARNPILGDTLARILRTAGHDVEVQYYMDNLGRQVALLYWGRANVDEGTLPPAARSKQDHELVRYYQAASDRMKADPATATVVQELVARLEAAEPALLEEVRKVYGACFAGMKATLDRLGVTYDSIKDESDLVLGGQVEEVIGALQKSPLAAQEEDGAWYLDMSKHLKGQKDRFYFTRKDGTSVYATRDVAYHAWKRQQVGPGRLVNVLGEDHRLQSLQVATALQEIGVAPPTVVFYSFVSLPEGKMSTRANRVVFIDDLLDESVERAREAVRTRRGHELAQHDIEAIAEAVGIAAVRFNIARIQPEKPIEFRWEEALSFDGDSAPYLLYAYARAASLVRKAKEAGIQPATEGYGAAEARLLELVARLPERAEQAAERLAPHLFASYALQLATAFNEYYRDHRVVGHEDPAEAAVRLATVDAARLALARSLQALGLPVLETM
jgi:arginyl-tRNA synthetase